MKKNYSSFVALLSASALMVFVACGPTNEEKENSEQDAKQEVEELLNEAEKSMKEEESKVADSTKVDSTSANEEQKEEREEESEEENSNE